MNKICMCAAVITVMASVANGDTWMPTKLTLGADPVIEYAFNGDPLSFDITVSGTPSQTVFCVFTKDQADDIVGIQNGYLGWHYVNRIDTCVYHNRGTAMTVGTNTVTWSGLDTDGNPVSPGDYTYYLYGYDHVTPKQPAVNVISIGSGRYDTIIAEDYNGNPYDRPILYTDPFMGGGDSDHPQPYPIFGSSSRDGQIDGELVNRMKFEIGSDPDDVAAIEKTWYPVWLEHCQYRPSPYDPDMFYIVTIDQSQFTGHMRRYTWVPNGESQQDMNWGDGGEVTWSIMTDTTNTWWVRMSACFEYIGQGEFIGCNTDHSGVSTESELPVIDAATGSIVRTIDLANWWIRPQDAVEHDGEWGQQSSGPNHADFRMVHGQPTLALTAHSSCLQNVINPQDPAGDYQRWINGNGDYFADHNWMPDDKNAWACNDYNPPARTFTATLDKHGFVMSSAYEEGAVSFHLFAPDGTGIDMFPYQGDTAGPKYINLIVQTGGAYDGIYCDKEDPYGGWKIADSYNEGVNYVAHDSISGTIALIEVGVEDAAPAAFTVEQNVPNPFNPSTTISFSLAEAGDVTIEIYTIGGQKADTLADGFMGAGSHSLIWDASGFSAGMYFCTIGNGGNSRTVKMTLLK